MKQDPSANLDRLIPPANRVVSYSSRARKPSDTIFTAAVEAMGALGIEPEQILHVGSSLTRDVGPAKKWGMRTALFAGDRGSLAATPDQLNDPQYRPDALLTDLGQVVPLTG
ncbi:MAG TPA: HAD hydrolase-like protein, partial [Gemmataceae bacterium]|nr:HAD hydrolase-like protein [Gemmataceae bacterium]